MNADMKISSRPLPAWLKWLCRILGVLILLGLLGLLPIVINRVKLDISGLKSGQKMSHGQVAAEAAYGTAIIFGMLFGLWLVRKGWKKNKAAAEDSRSSAAQTIVPAAPSAPTQLKNRHWHSCNILQIASDGNRVWHFEARSGGFALNREHRVALDEPLPARSTAKSWSSLWQPRLNVAWLPPENVFLRAIELPKSNFEETLAMVELQLEKLSPLPVAQIVWTIHVLPRRSPPSHRSEVPPAGETKAEDLQTVVVVIVERGVVEEFLGKLEGRGYLADRLEVPMLDQLEATPTMEDGAWVYPMALAGQNAALVAWWCGNALRSLSFVVLPPAGDRAKNLKSQLAQLAWAGELEGWLATPLIRWHLIADPAVAPEWETALREGLGEPVQVAPPLSPSELAARTARRAAAGAGAHTALLPAEFSARYHQQYVDRLWLRGLMATGVLYAIGVVIYFCATSLLLLQTRKVEQAVAAISGNYTNVMELQARYDVLKVRQDLKYAALDCWKVVAERLPAGVTLQRFSFANGQKLSLSGTAPADQVNTLFDFNAAMQKATNQNRAMFDLQGGEPVNPHITGNKATWSFSLQLQHAEQQP